MGVGPCRGGWCGLGRVRNTYSHAESTAKVIENDPGAGVASVIHGGGGGGGGGVGGVGEERGAKTAPVLRPARRVLGGLWVDSRVQISSVDGSGAAVMVVKVVMGDDRVGCGGRYRDGSSAKSKFRFSMISEAKEICSAAGITAH